jgi:uncharacterized protein YjbI with pentapeptide repeats
MDMDSDEAIRLLRGGSDGVNEWNSRHHVHDGIETHVQTDLEGVDLSNLMLEGVHFSRANLRKAKLVRAKLSGACLYDAELYRADLAEADLQSANLRSAKMFGAVLNQANATNADLAGAILAKSNLRNARLDGAHIEGADLTGAELDGARLHGARCGGTNFANLDLSHIEGLDTVVHSGPSSVDINTLFRSKGKIPDVFLRGCGVPESLIEYLPALVGSMQPIQFYSCFISHSSKDRGFADRLHGRMLQERLRVWYSPTDMRGGRKSHEQIDEAIRVHDKLLLVLSKASMASNWVFHEVTRAVEREQRENRRVLFPISLSPWKEIKAWSAFDADAGKDIAKVVREYHIPDFTNWKSHDSFEKGFARLLEDLKSEESTNPKMEGRLSF